MAKIRYSEFSGVNANDQGDALMRRLQAMGMVETPVSVNTEFYPEGIGRRKGHSAHEFTAAINNALVADDEILAVGQFTKFGGARRITVAVGKKAAYANPVESASFAQLYRARVRKGANGLALTCTSTVHAYPTDASEASIVSFDNRVLIGIKNSPRVLVYSGRWRHNLDIDNADQALPDDRIENSAYVMDAWMGGRAGTMTATAVASGGRTATVSSGDVNGLMAGDFVINGTDNAEINTIQSVNTASSIIVFDFTTGSTFGNTFFRGNTYTENYGSGSDISSSARYMTGAIDPNNYLVQILHNRLLLSRGDSLVNYSPVSNAANSGVWDFSAGGFFVTPAALRAMRQFIPEGGGDMNAHIYMFTDIGVASRPGMADHDQVIQNNSSSVVLNKDCVAQIENWLVYLTRDKQLRAVNGRMDIDLGRRLKSRDGSSGPLDQMDVARSESTAFLFYDPKKKKLYANFSSGTSFFNDRQAVLDFELGEPVLGEPLESFERRVRCLDWRIDEPTANEGFCTMAQIGDEVVGFKQDGTAWKLNDGDSDFGANKYQASWYTPQNTLGDPTVNKHWKTARVAMMNTGPHTVVFSKRANRQTTDVDMGSFEVSDADGIKINTQQVNQHKYAMQLGIRNENSAVAEPWVMTGISLEATADAAEL